MVKQNYTPPEYQVILDAKVQNFGAYLQNCWMQHEIDSRMGQHPKKQSLESRVSRMETFATEFDIVYLTELPEAPVNPLQEEQKIWRKLSPKIHGFLQDFQAYLNSPEEDIQQLQRHLTNWWDLLQEWNTLSKLYKPKLEEAYSYLRRQGIREITHKHSV